MTETPILSRFITDDPDLKWPTTTSPLIIAFDGQTLTDLRQSKAGRAFMDNTRWYEEYPTELLAPAGRYEVILGILRSADGDEDEQDDRAAAEYPGWMPTPVAVGLCALLHVLEGGQPLANLTFRMGERLAKDGRLQLRLSNRIVHVESRTAKSNDPAMRLSVCRLIN